LTEQGTQKRLAVYVVRDPQEVPGIARLGPDPLADDFTFERFRDVIAGDRSQIKGLLRDQTKIAGIGNAYSDEILHRAKLSPVKLTNRLSEDEIDHLFDATRVVLSEWTDRLRAEAGDEFPEKVTAFRPEMAVHGRFGEPCPVCGTPVQRIRYADNETNYCARCQTDGKLLADRALSRLLKQDWPRSIDDVDG
jgi:formamidopyrimidine-DNA glycosylase